MARNLAVTSRTGSEPGKPFDLDAGNIRPVGIGLRAGEIQALDQIADEYGLSRNACMRILVRLFIRQYEAGQLDMAQFVDEPEKPKNKPIYPK